MSDCPCHEAAVDGKVEESSEVRRQAARAAEGWYDAFTHDVFG
ncbi:FCSD flavin-binding domain-containing protein [Mesorhizobium sp.]|nr:FCSD flavin-binding domain-containing protein [Mesorhizobium sp.]